MTVAALATLGLGLIVGYLGQRSRMCFVAALRDFVFIRDTEKLKGLVAFLLVAWIAFPLAGLLGGFVGNAGAATPAWTTLLLTAIGGLGVGLLSTWANGCPFRQHVLAAQGSVSAMAYLGGFVAGALIFHAAVAPLLLLILP